jgi:hypothetical protein
MSHPARSRRHAARLVRRSGSRAPAIRRNAPLSSSTVPSSAQRTTPSCVAFISVARRRSTRSTCSDCARCSTARRVMLRSSRLSQGLRTKCQTRPALIAATRVEKSALPVSRMRTTAGCRSLVHCRSSTPEVPGMRSSEISTATRSASSSRWACAALVAVSTRHSAESSSARLSTTIGSSSTTRTASSAVCPPRSFCSAPVDIARERTSFDPREDVCAPAVTCYPSTNAPRPARPLPRRVHARATAAAHRGHGRATAAGRPPRRRGGRAARGGV